MKETLNAKNEVTQEYVGLFDMLEHIGDPKDLLRGHSHGNEGKQWYGTETFGEAIDLVKKGWEAGTARITNRMRDIEKAVVEIGTIYNWDVIGETFDVGALLSGEPECWLQPAPDMAKRLIRIYVNVCCSSSVSTRQIMNRGAAIVALVDTLQADHNNIVELLVGSVASSMLPYARQEQVVNFGMSPLPLNSISIALAHPAFLRRLVFAVWDRNNGGTKGGYGHVEELTAKEQEEYSLYMPGSFSGDGCREFDTPEGSARWIERQVARMTAVEGNYPKAA